MWLLQGVLGHSSTRKESAKQAAARLAQSRAVDISGRTPTRTVSKGLGRSHLQKKQ